MYNLFLIFIAIVPAFFLCLYVYKKDRVEKEPIGLLLKLFLFGALCCFPAAIAESILIFVLKIFFYLTNYIMPVSNFEYIIVENFLVIALVEEFCKFFVLSLVARNNKEFNSRFDGIIYAVFVSLGFATLENIFYVIGNGITVGIMRAVLSVPGHMFFAVMMGYFYSSRHIKVKANLLEKSLIKRGLINGAKPLFSSKKELFLCLIVPICLHGTYDVCCTINNPLATLLFIALVIFMYILCFGRIVKESKLDYYEDSYIVYMMKIKYPELNIKTINDIEVREVQNTEEIYA